MDEGNLNPLDIKSMQRSTAMGQVLYPSVTIMVLQSKTHPVVQQILKVKF